MPAFKTPSAPSLPVAAAAPVQETGTVDESAVVDRASPHPAVAIDSSPISTETTLTAAIHTTAGPPLTSTTPTPIPLLELDERSVQFCLANIPDVQIPALLNLFRACVERSFTEAHFRQAVERARTAHAAALSTLFSFSASGPVPLRLPDVLVVVFEYLTVSDLCSIALAAKQFYALAMEMILRHGCIVLPTGRMTFPEFCGHLQTVNLSELRALNLHSVFPRYARAYKIRDDGTYTPEEAGELKVLLSCLWHPQHTHVSKMTHLDIYSERHLCGYIDILSSFRGRQHPGLKSLTHLSLCDCDPDLDWVVNRHPSTAIPVSLLTDTLVQLPALDDLKLNLYMVSTQPVQALPSNTLSLRTLRLPLIHRISATLISWLFRSADNLKHVEVGMDQGLDHVCVQRTCARAGLILSYLPVGLESLEFGCLSYSNIPRHRSRVLSMLRELSGFLDRSVALRELEVYGDVCAGSDPVIMKAVVPHLPMTLEEFTLSFVDSADEPCVLALIERLNVMSSSSQFRMATLNLRTRNLESWYAFLDMYPQDAREKDIILTCLDVRLITVCQKLRIDVDVELVDDCHGFRCSARDLANTREKCLRALAELNTVPDD